MTMTTTPLEPSSTTPKPSREELLQKWRQENGRRSTIGSSSRRTPASRKSSGLPPRSSRSPFAPVSANTPASERRLQYARKFVQDRKSTAARKRLLPTSPQTSLSTPLFRAAPKTPSTPLIGTEVSVRSKPDFSPLNTSLLFSPVVSASDIDSVQTVADCVAAPAVSRLSKLNITLDDDDASHDVNQERSARKRRGDSHFLLLPTPSPLEKEQTPSATFVMSPTCAFSKVPSNFGLSDKDEVAEEEHIEAVVDDIRDEDGNDDTSTVFLIPKESVKVNEKSVLETVAEDNEETLELKEKLKQCMQEKQGLQNDLATFRRSYEERVTPFRNLFDDQRKLLAENARLRNEKKKFDATFGQIQTQMMSNLQQAVLHSKGLQQELGEAKSTIAKLEEEIDSLQL